MKCQNCLNIIISLFKCNICQNIFCSLSCLEIHFLKYHNENINNSINSPFLVKGTLICSIKSDSTYNLQNFIPVFDDADKLKIIGSGSFGEVYLGFNTITKKYYAIKHMDKSRLHKALKTLAGIYTEIDLQSRISHPNIVQLLYVQESKHLLI